MAKRRLKTTRRQHVVGEANRRDATALPLTQLPSMPCAEPLDAASGLPAPAHRTAWDRLSGPAQVSVCPAECAACTQARTSFDALRAASLVQRRRYDEPGRYPYTAGKHTLHRTTCREVEQSVGHIRVEDDSPWLQGALTTFAHEGISNSGWATHMRVLDAGEASAWLTERIGPRGGTRYRLCRICTPVLPASEQDR